MHFVVVVKAAGQPHITYTEGQQVSQVPAGFLLLQSGHQCGFRFGYTQGDRLV